MKTALYTLLISIVLLLNASLFFVLIYLIGKTLSWLALALLIPFAISGFKERDGLRMFITSSLLFAAISVTFTYNKIYLNAFCTSHSWATPTTLDLLLSSPLLYSGGLPRGLEKESIQLSEGAFALLSATEISLNLPTGTSTVWKPTSFEKLLEIRASDDKSLISLVVQNTSDEQVLIEADGSQVRTSYLGCGPIKSQIPTRPVN